MEAVEALKEQTMVVVRREGEGQSRMALDQAYEALEGEQREVWAWLSKDCASKRIGMECCAARLRQAKATALQC